MTARHSVSYSSGFDGPCFLSNVTTTDGDPSHYLEDPDLFADSLPQPFRRINRILNSIVDAALDTAEYNESKLINNVNHRRAPQYDSANIIAVCVTCVNTIDRFSKYFCMFLCCNFHCV